MDGDEHPFLPPTFEFLVISLKTQAEAALGLIRFSEDPGEQPREPNYRVARHAIDTLGMLQDKTKNNLAWEEERLLHNTLTELRFRFVQVHEMKKPAEPQATAGAGETSTEGQGEIKT